MKLLLWYYNVGSMSLHICPNPQNVQRQEWTPMWTMDSGRGWCVGAGFWTVRNDPLWQGMAIVGEALRMERAAGIRKLPVPSVQLCCEPDSSKNASLFLKMVLFMYLFLSVLCLRCFVQALSSCGEQRPLSSCDKQASHGFFCGALALGHAGFSSCGSWA